MTKKLTESQLTHLKFILAMEGVGKVSRGTHSANQRRHDQLVRLGMIEDRDGYTYLTNQGRVEASK